MNTRNPAFGWWDLDDSDDYNQGFSLFHGKCYNCSHNEYGAYYDNYSFDPERIVHTFTIDHLRLIVNGNGNVERLWNSISKIADLKYGGLIIEYDIDILKPVLQEENILPVNMSDSVAIRWLVAHCHGIKDKEEAA